MAARILLALAILSLQTATVLGAAHGTAGTVTFLHTNDNHAHIEPMNKYGSDCAREDWDGCFGGYPRMKTYIDSTIASSDHPVMYMDAGDMFMGTIWNTVFKGEAVADLRKLVTPAAVTFGNHEWDFGNQVLGEFVDNVTYPVICCNIDTTAVPELEGKYKKSHMFELDNGMKVGVVGWVTPDTKFLSSPGDVEFMEPAEPVQAEVDTLLADGADLIVGLSHTGYGPDQELAAATQGINLIIGGHTHSYLATGTPDDTSASRTVPGTPSGAYPTVVQGTDGKDVFITQSFWSGWFVGHITITKAEDGTISVADTSKPVFMDSSVAMDTDMVSAMEPWLAQLGNFRLEVVGEAIHEMSGRRSPGVRTEEAAMGNYITDALRYFVDTYRQDLISNYGDIDFVVQNGGGIRAGLGVGDITVIDIVTTLPFGNVFSIISLTGAKVMETLEQSVSGVEDAEGRFLQVSGIRYGFNQSQPVGSRIVFAHLETDNGWVLVDDDKSYNMLCANFIANGGDGYESLTSSELIFEYGNTLSDVVIQVTKEWGTVNHSPESLGNRIMNCIDTPDRCIKAVSTATVEEEKEVIIVGGNGAEVSMAFMDLYRAIGALLIAMVGVSFLLN